MNNKLTQARLKEVLEYYPEIGIFMWRPGRVGCRTNVLAGSRNLHGYRDIRVDRVLYKAHRLAWLYVHGYFPENDIDHIDKNPSNNRINNLRAVSRSCNMRNTGNPKTNMSGCKGVWWDKSYRKWRAMVTINQNVKGLGSFSDYDEAVCHRLAAEQCVNWQGCDSNSPAFQYVQKNIGKNSSCKC